MNFVMWYFHQIKLTFLSQICLFFLSLSIGYVYFRALLRSPDFKILENKLCSALF